MSGPVSDTVVSFIRKNDPSFPKNHFSFAELRQQGLTHIQNFSGKVWTDYNTHDPGITSLEVLIYALMDLGYRAQLPIEDLLARQTLKPGERDDNFFTPAQILTNNPLTITDYRQLLMELPDVRNVWFEVARPTVALVDCQSQGEVPAGTAIPLNGLYAITIEAEPDTQKSPQQIQQAVRQAMGQYRNLCEDVQAVTLLESTKIAITIEVDVEKTARLDEIHAALAEHFRRYFSPTVTYYTLTQLLEQNVPIEEAFAGRPYTTESRGFINTRELEQLRRRRDIRLSDLYSVAQNVPGVTSVRQLSAVREGGGPGEDWVIALNDNSVAVLDTLTVTFFKEGIPQVLQRPNVNRKTGKSNGLLVADDLDYAIPTGLIRKDLGDYSSVQNDFPSVYGIGNDELPESVGPVRLAQANQLRAYLFFYDQLLAGYITQLAHVRDLFSLRPDSQRDAKIQGHILFGESMSTVPHAQELIRFQAFQPDGPTEGTLLAIPIAKDALTTALVSADQWLQQYIWNDLSTKRLSYSRSSYRDFAAQQLQNDLRQGRFSLDTYQDQAGHFFVITPGSVPGMVLLSPKQYTDGRSVRFYADLVDVYGNQEEAVRPVNKYDTSTFSFDLVYKAIDYVEYLQNLLEDETRYQARRNAFLDHLLARFAESFTDYSLQLYQSPEQNLQQTNETKAQFLSQYDELSRSRSQACNYRRNSWYTDNRSGLEKKLLMELGISNVQVHPLCHFEVLQRPDTYEIELRNQTQTVILRNQEPYESESDARQALALLSQSLTQLASYQPEENTEIGQFWFRVLAPEGNSLISQFFTSVDERNQQLRSVQLLYSPQPVDGAIVPAYALHLTDAKQELVAQKTALYTDDVEQAVGAFVQSLHDKWELDPAPQSPVSSLPRGYLDKRAFTANLLPLPWRWIVNDTQGEKSYASEPETLQALALEHTTYPDLFKALFPTQAEGYQWELMLDETLTLKGLGIFRSTDDLGTDVRRIQRLLKTSGNFTVVPLEESLFLLELRNAQGHLVAVSPQLQGQADEWINRIVADTERTFKTVTVATPYSFRIAGQTTTGETVYLQSYYYYHQLADAIRDFLKTLVRARDVDAFQKQDNLRAAKYSFVLLDQDKHLLADYLEEFDDPTDRDSFLEKLVAWFTAYPSPLRVDQIDPPTAFTLYWQPQDTHWRLRLLRGYSSTEIAESDFYRMLHYAANNLLFRSDDLVVMTEDEPIAQIDYLGRPDIQPQPDRLIQTVSELIQQHQYRLRQVWPGDLWRFRYYLPDGTSWYESMEQFTSEADAQAAYQSVVSDLGKMRLKNRKTTGERVLTNAANKFIAQLYPASADPDIQQRFLDYKASPFKEPYAAVHSTPHTENPPQNWLYRVVRSDWPLAYHPQRAKITTFDDATQTLRRLRQNPFTRWLQICLGGDNVIERNYAAGTAYHFVIRRQPDHQILLISYEAFSSPEEADRAFQKRYPYLIELASNPYNYAHYEPDKGFVRLIAPSTPSADQPNWVISADEVYAYDLNQPLPRSGLVPLAVMPTRSEPDRDGAINDLTKLALSYPIRQVPGTDRFKFQVYDPEADEVQWRSADRYPSVGEAMTAFRQFLTTLTSRDNYVIRSPKVSTHGYQLFVQESLLESYRRYSSADQAWQALRDMILASHVPEAFVLESDTANYRFSVVAPADYYLIRHPARLETEDSCEPTIDQLIELATTKPATKVVQDEESGRWIYQVTCQTTVSDSENPCGCEQPDRQVTVEKVIWLSYRSFATQNEAEAVRKAIAPKLKDILAKPENYRCFPTTDGRNEIRIVDHEKGRLAYYPAAIPTRLEARKAIERTQANLNDDGMHLLEHLLLTAYSPTVQPEKPTGDCIVCWTDEPDPADPCSRPVIRPYAPCADPYSFWATVILPDWTSRFSQLPVRRAFEKMIRRQAPAHIGLQICWATPQAMCAFEAAYRSWLSMFRRYILNRDYQGLIPSANPSTTPIPWPTDAYCRLADTLNTVLTTRQDESLHS